MYLIYHVTFTTKGGTKRAYVGMTQSLNLRKAYLSKKPVTWMKCRGKSDLNFTILQSRIVKRASALAAEAWHSAKEIVRSRHTVRGACWCKPTLSDDMWRECQEVGGLESWSQVLDVVVPGSRLDKHLKDISYSAKGALQIKKSRSGTCGNKYRKQLVARGVLKKPAGAERLKVLHRGKDPVARRKVENAKR